MIELFKPTVAAVTFSSLDSPDFVPENVIRRRSCGPDDLDIQSGLIFGVRSVLTEQCVFQCKPNWHADLK